MTTPCVARTECFAALLDMLLKTLEADCRDGPEAAPLTAAAEEDFIVGKPQWTVLPPVAIDQGLANVDWVCLWGVHSDSPFLGSVASDDLGNCPVHHGHKHLPLSFALSSLTTPLSASRSLLN